MQDMKNSLNLLLLHQQVKSDNCNMRQAVRACLIFNPLYLQGKPDQLETLLNFMAEKLCQHILSFLIEQ